MVTVIQKGAAKETLKSQLEKIFKRRSGKGVDVKKYAGLISLKEDPLKLQKQWRNEWE